MAAFEGNRGTRGGRRGEITISLVPLDNRALANLCGPVDANLRQIEAAYDVAIARRGATFTLRGTPSQAEQAGSALQRFYARADEPLTVDDIQLGLIERIKSFDGGCNYFVNIAYGLQHSLTAVSLFISISQFNSFMLASGRS